MSRQKTRRFKSIQAAGGHARARAMSPDERKACASKAAKARWNTPGHGTLPTLDGSPPVRLPKCALCYRAAASHDPVTKACPAKNGDGFDHIETYMRPDLLPKTKAGLVQAYALALASIADMQAAKPRWNRWREVQPEVGAWVVARWPTPRGEEKYRETIGAVSHGGGRLFVGVWLIDDPATTWHPIAKPLEA